MKQNIEANEKLYEIAEGQQGLFTAKQAEAAGIVRNNHAYHVKAGNWMREERGIFRLNLFPHSREQQLVTYALWSQNRSGETQGVYSHETALSHHELSDVMPSKLHMTVPKSFRRNSEIPKLLVLHYGDLPKSGWKKGAGFHVTTPIQTILDVIQEGKLSFEHIEQAIRDGIKRGLIRRTELKNELSKIKVDATIQRELETVLKEAA